MEICKSGKAQLQPKHAKGSTCWIKQLTATWKGNAQHVFILLKCWDLFCIQSN